MRRVVLCVVATTMVVCVASVSAAGKAGTRVTLDAIQIQPTGTIWTGDIFSPKKACKNKRKVIIYRVRAGADQKRGSTRSYKGKAQPGYFWAYVEDGIPPAGNYYAKVLPNRRCKGDRSPQPGCASGSVNCPRRVSGYNGAFGKLQLNLQGPPECFGRPATIESDEPFVPGTLGGDVIVTGGADNGVIADSGNDRVCTRGGDDFVRGDLGDDRINLGPGADKASGGDLDPNNPSGNDVIKGEGGRDELNGHDGDDVLGGGRGGDLLRGGPGKDVLNGGPNRDTCRGGPGQDTLINCEN